MSNIQKVKKSIMYIHNILPYLLSYIFICISIYMYLYMCVYIHLYVHTHTYLYELLKYFKGIIDIRSFHFQIFKLLCLPIKGILWFNSNSIITFKNNNSIISCNTLSLVHCPSATKSVFYNCFLQNRIQSDQANYWGDFNSLHLLVPPQCHLNFFALLCFSLPKD